jgi:hypothetical protein
MDRYKAPPYTLIQRLKLIRGWWRFKVFGFCPACNSDAPGIYNCQVCGGWRYPGDGRVRQRLARELWWGRFLVRLRLKDYGK